jgi:CheY-like chemotaxis protein
MHNKPPVILIADDDRDDQEMLEDMLRQVDSGATVHTAMTCTEVFRYLDNACPGELPDLVVLDYNIPGLNGMEIFKLMQDNPAYRHLPVVFWTTSNSLLLKTACESAGALLFATKPSSFEGVQQLARQLISICHKQAM